MPKLGTINRLQLKSGELIETGARLAQVQGSIQPQYDGQILGIWYVEGTAHEPEHYDVLAVPSDVFKAMMGLAAGIPPEKVYADLTEAAKKMLASGKKPGAVRRVYHMGDGPMHFHDAVLSMEDAFHHYQDRWLATVVAYEEDEDDDEDEDGEGEGDGQTVQPVNGAAQPGMQQSAMPVATTGA